MGFGDLGPCSKVKGAWNWDLDLPGSFPVSVSNFAGDVSNQIQRLEVRVAPAPNPLVGAGLYRPGLVLGDCEWQRDFQGIKASCCASPLTREASGS